MAASSEVAAFRAAGHSVAETMRQFGLSERSVYNHVARVRRSAVPSSLAAEHAPAALVEHAPAAPVPADDVAGDHSYWRCPVSGDLLPVVPGARRHAWMEERRRLFARPAMPAPAPVVRAPVAPAPAPAPVALAPVAPVVVVVRPPLARHNIAWWMLVAGWLSLHAYMLAAVVGAWLLIVMAF